MNVKCNYDLEIKNFEPCKKKGKRIDGKLEKDAFCTAKFKL